MDDGRFMSLLCVQTTHVFIRLLLNNCMYVGGGLVEPARDSRPSGPQSDPSATPAVWQCSRMIPLQIAQGAFWTKLRP